MVSQRQNGHSELQSPSALIVVRESSLRADVLHVFDEVDLATAPELERRVDQLTGPRRCVLNFADCRYIDSSTLAVLIRAFRRLGDHLRIVVPLHSRVERVLGLAGLHDVLPIVPSMERALG
jgi:anti-anti-sigma factor